MLSAPCPVPCKGHGRYVSVKLIICIYLMAEEEIRRLKKKINQSRINIKIWEASINNIKRYTVKVPLVMSEEPLTIYYQVNTHRYDSCTVTIRKYVGKVPVLTEDVCLNIDCHGKTSLSTDDAVIYNDQLLDILSKIHHASEQTDKSHLSLARFKVIQT